MLLKLFVKNYKIHLMQVCVRHTGLSGMTGIAVNLLLFVIKTAAGIMTGSISIMPTRQTTCLIRDRPS